MKSTPLMPKNGVVVQNITGSVIPPRSVVVVSAVNTNSATTTQDAQTYTQVEQYAGQTGNILVTGSAPIKPGGYGRAFYDNLIFVAIDPNVSPPTVGEEWGPSAGNWYVTRGGNGFFCHGFDPANAAPGRAIFYRSSPSGSGGSSTGSGCGCCACYSCITSAQATVGGCAAAPNGAPRQFQFEWGANKFSDSSGTSSTTTFTYGSPVCGSSSSSSSSSSYSSSSSSSSAGSGCSWYSCPVSICQPSSSSSSSSSGSSSSSSSSSSSYSSSSSSSVCGTYQLVLTLVSITDPVTGLTEPGAYISERFTGVGTDWAGVGA